MQRTIRRKGYIEMAGSKAALMSFPLAGNPSEEPGRIANKPQ